MTAAIILAKVLSGWWKRLLGHRPTQRRPLPFEPSEIACERETSRIKARITSGILLRRIEACRWEILSEESETIVGVPPVRIVSNPKKYYEKPRDSDRPGA